MITLRFPVDLMEEEMEESIYHVMETFGFDIYEGFDIDINDQTKAVGQFEGNWADFEACQDAKDILTENCQGIEFSDEETL